MGRFGGLITTAALTLVALLLVALVWPAAIENFNWVQPIGRQTLAQWIDNFRFWGIVGVVCCSLFAFLWQGLGEFYWKVVDSGVSLTWWILALLAATAALLPAAFLLAPAEGSLWAFVAYAVDFALVFGASTVGFSPPTVMFVPPGSKLLRR
jgi:hypothetical protein